jgi:uncharacterized SAM-binding protein YcdF (DUF218 family)
VQESTDDLDQIARYLDIHVDPAPADLAIVFGTRLEDPALLTAHLYHQGYAPAVVLTGGANRLTGVVEAEQHRTLLIARGVPEQALLVEAASTNTYENVCFALPLIARRFDLAAIRRVIVIAKWYHSRRATMTLRRQLPPGIRYYPVTYEPDGLGRAGWQVSEATRAAVIGNWQAIPTYLARGHLAEIVRDGDAYI